MACNTVLHVLRSCVNSHASASVPLDGIGPEIMNAALSVFKAARVPIAYQPVEMGKDIYLKGPFQWDFCI
jgi:isocitrate dehydrogenase